MAWRGLAVVWNKGEPGRIPDALRRGAALLVDLGGRGHLAVIADRLRIRREGGYSGLDVLVFLMLYFAGAERMGLRRFWDVARGCSCQLAALAGRSDLPSPASISRALGRVDLDVVRALTPWLLVDMSGIDAVLAHPAVLYYDAQQLGWHVFDYDPTVHALRQRALPQNRDDEDDLPEACRRSGHLCATGYPGRKRGEVQYRRGTLQHAGSGAWLNVQLAPGNTGRAEGIEAALDAIVAFCKRLGWPLERALLRIDGEFGWVPHYAACRARGVPFVTRLTRPEMFDDPHVIERLDKAVWYLVDDSRSGPHRSATDLGVVSIPPGKETRGPDGAEYAPVEARVVVSRFPRDRKANHGRVIGGWQYELFLVDADVASWPAHSAVTLYFGRSGQENRFAQEDREVGLDRIFSYAMAGQQLAVVIGLWVWNLRIARGFAAKPPPAERPHQTVAPAVVDKRQAPLLSSSTVSAPEPPSVVPSTAMEPTPAPKPKLVPEINVLLGEFDWTGLLAEKPGWSWDSQTGDVVCPEGRRLTLATVTGPFGRQQLSILEFRRPTGGCERCPTQHRCLGSDRPEASKQLFIPVLTPHAEALRDALHGPRDVPVPVDSPPVPKRAAPSPKSPRRAFQIDDVTGMPGPFVPLPPLFLPAAARRELDRTLLGTSLFIHTVDRQPKAPRPRLVAATVEERQHRRLTWGQHLKRYALPDGAAPRVEIRGGDAMKLWMPDQQANTSRASL